MSEERETPYTVSRGSVTQDGFLLTNVEWHPSSMFGIDAGQPETGIRYLQPNGKYDDFELIQHGWWDFDRANKIILKALNKGWSCNRISEFMDNFKDRS